MLLLKKAQIDNDEIKMKDLCLQYFILIEKWVDIDNNIEKIKDFIDELEY